jgi:hypothetical protein
LKTNVWLCLLKRSPKSYILLQTLFPLPSRRTLQSLNTVHFRTGINTHAFDALHHSVQKMSDIDRYCCLLFDEMSIRRMSGLIRNLTVSRDLRILEVRAGRATLQIMLCFSWSVVCIGSGSSRWLTSVVEVLRLRCLCNY